MKKVSLFDLNNFGKTFLVFMLFQVISCRYEDKKNGLSKIPADKGYVTRCKLLGIDNLKQYTGNTQIRVWLELSLSDSGKILIVKNTGATWKATLIYYRFEDMENELKISNKTTLEKNANTAYQDFSNSLLHSGIYEINDSTRGREWNLCTDGGALRIELFKDDKYQEYIYPCYPESYNTISLNRVMDYLRLCEVEFGFKLLPLNSPGDNDSLPDIKIKKVQMELE